MPIACLVHCSSAATSASGSVTVTAWVLNASEKLRYKEGTSNDRCGFLGFRKEAFGPIRIFELVVQLRLCSAHAGCRQCCCEGPARLR